MPISCGTRSTVDLSPLSTQVKATGDVQAARLLAPALRSAQALLDDVDVLETSSSDGPIFCVACAFHFVQCCFECTDDSCAPRASHEQKKTKDTYHYIYLFRV